MYCEPMSVLLLLVVLVSATGKGRQDAVEEAIKQGKATAEDLLPHAAAADQGKLATYLLEQGASPSAVHGEYTVPAALLVRYSASPGVCLPAAAAAAAAVLQCLVHCVLTQLAMVVPAFIWPFIPI